MRKTMKPFSIRALVSSIGLIIGLAGMAFLLRTMWTHRDEMKDSFSQLTWSSLVGAVFFAFMSMSYLGWMWGRLLLRRGYKVPRAQLVSWYYTGQLGKYVPGGVWAVVGRAEMAVRGGVPRADAYSVTGLSMFTTYSAAALCAALGSLLSWERPIIGAALLLALVFGLSVYAIAPLRQRLMGLLRKVTSGTNELTAPKDMLALTIVQVPAWIMISLSTTITAHAFGAEVGVLHMFFVSSLSWLIGFLVIGAPGGLGVRESIFTGLLSASIGTSTALSLAVASRMIFVSVDFLGALIFNVIARKLKPTVSEAPTQ
ncbi:MAG: lysylphosphatidylglycerol synthase transmembrane domain-containing protein [Actinobacteria bacterium]|nr:lysylphosphatidylglycerol synthase transmembrane domain-containing protein [Actinomycetota bacterium]